MTDTPAVPVHLKRALTPAEAAALTGYSARTIKELAFKGVLRRLPHTSKVLIPRSAIDDLVDGGAA